MTHLIKQSCCNDASCVVVCPVDAIHPRPDEPGYMDAEMLYIDPDACIDCGACVPACPVGAILPDHEITRGGPLLLQINTSFYRTRNETATPLPKKKSRTTDFAGLRVAVVGSGPSAQYAAQAIMAQAGAQVDMFERLPVPYGLIRSGVAPDHEGTKGIVNVFRSLGRKKGFRLHLGVEVGNHISHEELLEHFHAVVYAIGAARGRALGIPGEDLPGSNSATEFVAWYNSHPDFVSQEFDLAHKRAVIVGNGNVALDIARFLVGEPEGLAATDVSEHALDTLRTGHVEEVVILGRRGPAQAAYTNTEFVQMLDDDNFDVVIDPRDVELDPVTAAALEGGTLDPVRALKVELAQRAAQTPPLGGRKRVVFRFGVSPLELLGDARVEQVAVARNRLVADPDGFIRAVPTDEVETIKAGLVLRSVGYTGSPLDPLPFDETTGVMPNIDGRVVDPASGDPLTGVYVTGWIKRGPSGGIGSNRKCASDTVGHLLDDFAAGTVPAPARDGDALEQLLTERQPDRLDFSGWTAINKAERAAGIASARPRKKFTTVAEMLEAARSE
jgi:ferredoxin--NADP+ reductase